MSPFNIFNELQNNYMDLNVHDFRIQGSIDYKPIPKVKLTALAAVKSAVSSMEHRITERFKPGVGLSRYGNNHHP